MHTDLYSLIGQVLCSGPFAPTDQRLPAHFSSKGVLEYFCFGDNLRAESWMTLEFLSGAGIEVGGRVCVEGCKAAAEHGVSARRGRVCKGSWTLKTSGTSCWG